MFDFMVANERQIITGPGDDIPKLAHDVLKSFEHRQPIPLSFKAVHTAGSFFRFLVSEPAYELKALHFHDGEDWVSIIEADEASDNDDDAWLQEGELEVYEEEEGDTRRLVKARIFCQGRELKGSRGSFRQALVKLLKLIAEDPERLAIARGLVKSSGIPFSSSYDHFESVKLADDLYGYYGYDSNYYWETCDLFAQEFNLTITVISSSHAYDEQYRSVRLLHKDSESIVTFAPSGDISTKLNLPDNFDKSEDLAHENTRVSEQLKRVAKKTDLAKLVIDIYTELPSLPSALSALASPKTKKNGKIVLNELAKKTKADLAHLTEYNNLTVLDYIAILRDTRPQWRYGEAASPKILWAAGVDREFLNRLYSEFGLKFSDPNSWWIKKNPKKLAEERNVFSYPEDNAELSPLDQRNLDLVTEYLVLSYGLNAHEFLLQEMELAKAQWELHLGWEPEEEFYEPKENELINSDERLLAILRHYTFASPPATEWLENLEARLARDVDLVYEPEQWELEDRKQLWSQRTENAPQQKWVVEPWKPSPEALVELEQFQEELRIAMEKESDLERELARLRSELASRRLKADELDVKIAEAKAEADDLDGIISENEELFVKLSSTLDERLESATELDKRKGDIEEQVAAATAEEAALRSSVEELEARLLKHATFKAELETLAESSRANLEELESLENSKLELETDLRAKLDAIKRLETQKAELQASLASAETQEWELRETVEALDVALKTSDVTADASQAWASHGVTTRLYLGVGNAIVRFEEDTDEKHLENIREVLDAASKRLAGLKLPTTLQEFVETTISGYDELSIEGLEGMNAEGEWVELRPLSKSVRRILKEQEFSVERASEEYPLSEDITDEEFEAAREIAESVAEAMAADRKHLTDDKKGLVELAHSLSSEELQSHDSMDDLQELGFALDLLAEVHGYEFAARLLRDFELPEQASSETLFLEILDELAHKLAVSYGIGHEPIRRIIWAFRTEAPAASRELLSSRMVARVF